MIKFLKQNGYPYDMTIETKQTGDTFLSVYRVNGKHLRTLNHQEFVSRNHFARGFGAGWQAKVLEDEQMAKNFTKGFDEEFIEAIKKNELL